MEKKPGKKYLELERKWLASFPKFNHNPIIELDDSGQVIFANPAAKKFLKDSRLFSNLDFFIPSDIGAIMEEIRKNKKQHFHREVAVGKAIFSEVIQVVPEFETVRIYTDDITERTQAEEALKNFNRELEEQVNHRTKELLRYNQALSMLSACNMSLVYSDREEKLLNDICGIIVEKGAYKMAWVGNVQQNKRKSILPLAQVGFEAGYLEKAHISWSEKTLRGRGPTGRAIREDKIAIGRYLSTDPRLDPWRSEALKRGYASSIALPLKTKDTILGVLTIYSADPKAFDKREIALLKELADDLAFGISSLRIKKAHDENKKYLEINNRLLKISNKSVSRKAYLETVVLYIKKLVACSYAGIRILNKEGFIPYDSYVGFSYNFWKSENFLSVKKDQCACIRVISEKPDPQDLLAMTKLGSFYTNNSLKFVSGLSEKEKERFRGKCVRCGFSSISIIPIRSKGKVIGAIHLADKKPDIFPLEKVQRIESLTPLVGEGIEKFNASDKMRANEKKYRELVQFANSIIVRLDSKGNILFLNEFAETFFGYKKEELAGRNAVGTIIPKTESSGRDLALMMKDIIKNPEKYTKNENENIKKNKERIWVSWHNRAIFDKNNNIKGILSVGNDITDRKKKEEQLLESYKHLGMINRKISFLSELDQLTSRYKNKNKAITRSILNSLENFSSASFGALYKYEDEKIKAFRLISSAGSGNNTARAVKIITHSVDQALKLLSQKNTCLRGTFADLPLSELKVDKNLKYFMLVPFNWENKLKAFMYLGFKEQKDFSAQELEFFDVFSSHASASFIRAGIFKLTKTKK